MAEFKVLVETPDGSVREFITEANGAEHAGQMALSASPEMSSVLAISGRTTGLKPNRDRVHFDYV